MRLGIILPSHNEAENIASVIKKVDKGICRYFDPSQCRIVHVDNNSDDGTISVAEAFVTRTPRVSIDNSKSEHPGKGSNILRGLQELSDYDAVLMFDTDLKTFDPNWIDLFAQQIFYRHTDLVTPIYSRNRYEGNTTNHFSCPLLSVFFDEVFYQPIAGDFGFSNRMVTQLVNSFEWPSDYKYGVDTLITWTARGNAYEVAQIPLGKKIHNPSFGKIVPMFIEVALSTLRQISRYRKDILNRLQGGLNILDEELNFINIDEEFVSKPKEEAILSLNRQITELMSSGGYLKALEDEKLLGITSNTWQEVLFLISYIALSREPLTFSEAEKLVQILTPLYLKRVLLYFDQINNLDASSINSLLETQLKDFGRFVVDKCKK